jgi:nucleotide-binding universal stress UspA family protein
MKKIVLGYDDSDASQRALERAIEFAIAFDSELIVTSVAPVIASIGRSTGPVDPTEPEAKHFEELNRARERLEGSGITAELQPAVGSPAATIVEVAQRAGADMIVVGTHEPTVLERMFGLSVSEGVAHKAHCDVLIVH